MSSNYPGAVDTFETNTDWTGDPNAAPATARITATDMNNVQDGLHNVQVTLGTNPQGSYADVKARLDALAAGGGAGALTERGNWTTITGYTVSDVVTQTGVRYVCRVSHTSGTFASDLAANKWVALDAAGTTPGGDLTGTIANATVAKIQNRDVAATAPTSGQALVWNGTAWAPATVAGGGGAVSSVVGQTGAVTGTQILNDTAVAAALTAKADAAATTTALAGKLATTAGAVGTSNLADGSVTAAKVAADVATQAELDAAIAALPGTYGRKPTPTSKTGAYTAAVGELVLADATSAGFTVTLPASPSTGDVVWVKKTDATANVVTVAAAGKTIDGDANATIIAEDAGAEFAYDGTNWRVTAVMTTVAGSGGGGAVSSVVGQTGAVTGAQILADTTIAAALAAKADAAATTLALAGKLGTTAQAADSAKIAGVTVTGTPTAGQVPVASSGTAAAWGTVSGGGAVSSVVGQTGAVTGAQIIADTTVAAALARAVAGPPGKFMRGPAAYQNVFWQLTASTGTFGINFAEAYPAQYSNAWSLDRVGIEVTTLASGGTARLALYADNGSFKPGTLIQEFTSGGTIDTSTTGIKELTVSQAFQPGVVYWWAFVALGNNVGIRTVAPTWPAYSSSQATAVNSNGPYAHEWGTTTFGSTWAGSSFGGGIVPSIFARVV